MNEGHTQSQIEDHCTVRMTKEVRTYCRKGHLVTRRTIKRDSDEEFLMMKHLELKKYKKK